MHLLDINFLLAVFFKKHPHHEKAAQYYREFSAHGWATCPITENGFLRIGLQQVFRDEAQSSSNLRNALRAWKLNSNHQFWADDISITNDLILEIPENKSVTELYLLALAVKNGGKFISFDKRIQADLVRGGKSALIVIS